MGWLIGSVLSSAASLLGCFLKLARTSPCSNTPPVHVERETDDVIAKLVLFEGLMGQTGPIFFGQALNTAARIINYLYYIDSLLILLSKRKKSMSLLLFRVIF